jgi:hypothetical protein
MLTVLKELPLEGQVFEVEGHVAFLILPKQQTIDKSMPWVWYAPTLPGLPNSSEKWMFDQFLKAGIAIAGVDVGESYGSPKGRALYSELYKELTNKENFSKKACLLARSRGGLMLYNWAVENPMFVACIAGIYPVCNLLSYPGLKIACEAYELSEKSLASQLAKHNPIDRLSSLAQAGVPIFHIHGDSDSAVPLEQNSAELYRRYVRLGGKMQLIVATGQGHNMWTGFFECQEMVDFVIAQAITASVKGGK